MGPKKKGKGKKDKKKKGSGGQKKDAGNVLTFNEAVMMHQLEVKLAQVKDLKDDLEDLKFRNERQKQRNQFLTKEQDRHIKNVLDQAHDLAKVAESKEKVPYEDVERALHGKLASIRVEELFVEELNKQIDDLEEEIDSHSRSLEEVKSYEEQGQHVDRTHIEVLNKEMVDMDRSYAEISDFFEKSLMAVKQSIAKKNEVGINSQKKLVSDLAIQNLDSFTETEFLDNKWLHKEVDIHRRHIEGVHKEVELLEQHNISIMSQLFDKQMEDVIETKQFYLACKEADTQQSVSLAMVRYDVDCNEDDDDEEEVIAEDGEYNETSREEDPPDLLDHYLTEFENILNEDDYKLGPMEIQLLCVYGNQMSIKPYDANHNNSDGQAVGIKKFTKFTAEREELTIVK